MHRWAPAIWISLAAFASGCSGGTTSGDAGAPTPEADAAARGGNGGVGTGAAGAAGARGTAGAGGMAAPGTGGAPVDAGPDARATGTGGAAGSPGTGGAAGSAGTAGAAGSAGTAGGTASAGAGGTAAGGAAGMAGAGGSPPVGGTCADLFEQTLQTFSIDIAASDWAAIQSEFITAAQLPDEMFVEYEPTYYPVVFHYGSETVSDAYIRLKGDSSWREAATIDGQNGKMQFVV